MRRLSPLWFQRFGSLVRAGSSELSVVCIVNINVMGNESGANCDGRAPTGSVGCKTV
jgi:hypothetical protein